ncbi:MULTISPECIES: hypothetical protein [Candidatus Nitrosocaldus]|uniref:Uncharacterized protein n=1 Tax=Candidatus Nitrosocaldus cavascurensis TaxID=2058097 RepID=A0A2K5ARE9_9ARCH|nr:MULTISPECIES: hypothetical protein [Candidatus Nitrosocaldus]SPC34226.1 protein of unknown function [Candidatus Nitrosocaldus cavascurensis]
MISRLAISDNERYVVTLHPSIALDYILALIAQGYSIHAYENATRTAIVIRVKKKEKQTVNISNKAKRLLEIFMYSY